MAHVLVTKRELKLLEPYLLGEAARENGEWDMFCPLHEDSNRSANLNVHEAIWRCHAGCGGGPVGQLIDARGDWVAPGVGSTNGSNGNGNHSNSKELPNEGKVAGWSAALLDNADGSLSAFKARRGLHEAVLAKFQLGWDMRARAYTIPIRDRRGILVGLRRYQLDPAEGRRKMWGVQGHNQARLYPIAQVLEAGPDEPIVVTEGELDALACIQAGYAAITRTASATAWSPNWSKLFKGRVVYVGHDADLTGTAANQKVGSSIAKYAKEVRILSLPYGIVEKHGKDLSDFWLEHGMDEFEDMLSKAMLINDPRLKAEHLPEDARVIDALDSRRARQPLRLTVTIEGKASPGYTIPSKAKLVCGIDAGNPCEGCPLKDANGEDTWEPEAGDAHLEMMDTSKKELHEYIRRDYGAKCKTFVTVVPIEEQAVETLFVRPSIDHSLDEQDYTSLRVRRIGGHDTPTNETVQLLGALFPSPKSQVNEFVAWEAHPMETSIDRFELDNEAIRVLSRFRPAEGQSSYKKLRLIAKELEKNVTHIYGRTEMHMAMDLTWHSGLAFEFDRQQMERGWLELLVVGDTRTGKSEAARLLARHLGAGEIVSCETASLPGILGAVQQPTGQGQWAITWGKIPLNDRRCVVLDEVDGLSPHEIASLSHLRSSGVAEISKVKAGRTHARTRLIWLGNPREGSMSQYTFGIEALQPLIGKPEDIARFDLVMTVAMDEVHSDIMNVPHTTVNHPRYTAEASHTLLRWAWSRKADQIKWQPESEKVCFAEAKKMGARYTENPPLVQAANVRIKIARVAVALALRTFSTDSTHEVCIVTPEHVLSAVKFMNKLYTMPGFGYGQRSDNMHHKHEVAIEHYDEAHQMMRENIELAIFMRDGSKFKRWDLESFVNLNKDDANATVSRLFSMHMLDGSDGNIWPTPELREILRGIKA